MMIVVSKNQVILPSFIPIMVNSEDYQKLKEDQQRNIDEMMRQGATSIRYTDDSVANEE